MHQSYTSSVIQFAKAADQKTDPSIDRSFDPSWAKLQNSLNSVLTFPKTGFQKVTDQTELFLKSEELGQTLRQKYTHFVIIGIGGSSMGARAIAEITHSKNLFFLDNVDSAEFQSIWDNIKPNLNTTALIGISKTGSTIEVLWNYSQVVHLAKKLNVDLVQQSYFSQILPVNIIALY
jgi:glucose-6-phosphate isomerase